MTVSAGLRGETLQPFEGFVSSWQVNEAVVNDDERLVLQERSPEGFSRQAVHHGPVGPGDELGRSARAFGG